MHYLTAAPQQKTTPLGTSITVAGILECVDKAGSPDTWTQPLMLPYFLFLVGIEPRASHTLRINLPLSCLLSPFMTFDYWNRIIQALNSLCSPGGIRQTCDPPALAWRVAGTTGLQWTQKEGGCCQCNTEHYFTVNFFYGTEYSPIMIEVYIHEPVA